MKILNDLNPVLMCCAEAHLEDEQPREFAVPVIHEAGPPDAGDAGVIAEVAASLREDHELVRHAIAHAGTRLFVPVRAEGQDEMGALMLFPAKHWPELKEEWLGWLFDGPEEAFEGLDFGFDDVMPFMRRNHSPDLWFVVLRGPQKGHYGFWGHDGECEEDLMYAESLDALMDRVCTEVDEYEPDSGLKAFGGVNIYPGGYSDEPDATSFEALHPMRYLPSRHD